VPTAELLDFQLAHARARDAVHAPFDAHSLAANIAPLGVATLCLASAAKDRDTFLKRPDLGRQLDEPSRELLATAAASLSTCDTSFLPTSAGGAQFDLAIVVSDGLSPLAAQRQVVPLLEAWIPHLRTERRSIAPVVVVSHGRVAIEDEIGFVLGARVAVILIGERPGLGSPDSLGAYLVYGPRAGLTDAHRNCLSNIRPQGLAPEATALKLDYLLRESLVRQLSGVTLKDESLSIERIAIDSASSPGPRTLPDVTERP
jgi:ethanolamine ammonia-lyase small subunit